MNFNIFGNSKKGFLLRDLGIMIVVLSIVAASCGLFFADFNTGYGTSVNQTVNTSFADAYNKINDMNSTAYSIQNQINNNESTISTSGDIISILKGGWGAIKMAFGGLGMAKTVADDMTQTLKLPTWLPLAVTIIIVLIIMFGVINAVFRFFQPL